MRTIEYIQIFFKQMYVRRRFQKYRVGDIDARHLQEGFREYVLVTFES